MKAKPITFITLLIFLLTFIISCTRDALKEPSPLGPSSFSILLYLVAKPNVIYAGESRSSTSITATLKKYDGTPLPNYTIYFEIADAGGNKLNLGYFDSNEPVKSKVTNSSGVATVIYYGPVYQELSANTIVYIWASVAWEGKEYIYEVAPVEIIKEPKEYEIEVEALPDVLYATEERPQAEIRAVAKKGGAPYANERVYFSIRTGPGYFSDNKTSTFTISNDQGVAAITYIGPNQDEVAGDESVIIRAQITESVYKEIYLRIIRQR